MTKAAELGGRIRELRYRLGMTQAQLAVRAGVGEKTLSCSRGATAYAGTCAAYQASKKADGFDDTQSRIAALRARLDARPGTRK